MKFNMEDLNPGSWFYFDDSNHDDGKIMLRVLTTGKLSQIRSETVETKVEYHNANRHEFRSINEGLRDSIIWDYCIVDWVNLNDDDDIPIECNKENKLKLMNSHPSFALFVEQSLRSLNENQELFREYREKN